MRAMGNTGSRNRSKNSSSDVANENRNMPMEPTMPLLLPFHKVNQILENDHHFSLTVMAKVLSL